MKVKARFVWADGYMDHRNVLVGHIVWRRFRWDREDVDSKRRYDLLYGSLNLLGSDGALTIVTDPDVAEFERASYDDSSFEFIERRVK